MCENLAQLRVDGLTSLQLAELRAAIAATSTDVTTLDNPSFGGGKVGEPTLFTIIITLSPAAIAAVAMWLAKQKKERRRYLNYTRIDPKGGMESFKMEESSYDEGESPLAAFQAFLEKKLGNDAAPTG